MQDRIYITAIDDTKLSDLISTSFSEVTGTIFNQKTITINLFRDFLTKYHNDGEPQLLA